MKKAVIAFLVLIVSCDQSINKKVESAMHNYDDRILHTDAKGISEMFMTDGEMAPPGMPPIVGRDSIKNFLAQFSGVKVEQQNSTTDSIIRIHDTAFQYGKYYQRDVVNDSTIEIHGMFKANWVLQPNGELLLKRMSAWSTTN